VRSIPGLLVALITASPPASEVAATGLTESRRIRDADIRFFESRIVRDPGGALDLVRLGGLLLLRYRDRGDEQDLVTAERAARRALSNRGRHNDAGWRLLTAALSGQHRFLEARRGAERQVAMAPEDAAAQAILGEVLLELGEYPAADRIFRRLTPRRFEPALAPRYARWLELRGQAGAARRLLESARDAATGAGDLIPFEQRAWYDLRLAELAFRFRAWRTAAREIENGLARVPDDWRLLALAARLALRTGTVDRAIDFGNASLAQRLDPATLATVGDAWQRKGNPGRAEEHFRAMEAMSQSPPGGFHRSWYLALLDHDRRIPEVLARVQADLETRRDVYGYDLFAWALYKSGRTAEARRVMSQALAWGTEDPELRARARILGVVR
jgi:tetratricopeptide (TPR) repeat protein